MLSRILENFQSQGHKVALCYQGQSLTYGELGHKVQAVASYLEKYQNKPIAVETSLDNFDCYACVLGILFSGNTYVPIKTGDSKERVKHILAESQAVEFIKTTDWEADFSTPFSKVKDILQKKATGSKPLSVKEEQTAYILFTSGSTGKSKGVVVSVGNLNAFLGSVQKLAFGFSGSDRFLQMMDLSFDVSIFTFMLPLTLGATVCPIQPGPSKFLSIYQVLKEEKITVAVMVPSVIRLLKPFLEGVSLPALRYSIFTAESLFETDAKAWQMTCGNSEIWNVYGPTEATVICTATNFKKMKSHNGIVCIGQPMPGNNIEIHDQNNKSISAPGVQGQICISGPQLAKSYLDAAETAARFFLSPDGIRFYRTGDIGFKDKDGDIFFCGREDQQVKIQGFRVELEGIQFFATQFAGVPAFAVAEQLIDGNAAIFLFLENWRGQIEDLREFLKKNLAAYELPFKIRVIEKFKYLDNGKIDRQFLKSLIKDKSP